MTALSDLPQGQQRALDACVHGTVPLRRHCQFYVNDRASVPLRTIKALVRAGLMELRDGTAVLTDAAKAVQS